MEPPPPAWVGTSRLLRVILWITGAGMILLVVLWSQARDRDGDELPVQLMLGGSAAWCFLMAASWRWIPILGARFVDPGPNLGALTKAIGGFGVCALPAALRLEAWPFVAVGGSVGAATLALWLGYRWAVWPWYLVGVGCFVLAGCLVWLAIDRWSATAPPGGQPPDLPRLQSVLVTALGALGVVLIRELERLRRAWRRPVDPLM